MSNDHSRLDVMNGLRVLAVTYRRQLERELELLGVEPLQARMLATKGLARAVRVADIDPREAGILRQEMLSLGADAALGRPGGKRRTRMVLLGTMHQYQRLIDRLRAQPGELPHLARQLSELLKDWESPPRKTLRAGPYSLPIGDRTYVMGIINVTADSFSGDGVLGRVDLALERVRRFIEDGADIIDVGGESARADVPVVDVAEEIDRVVPVIEAITSEFAIPVSIDTYKPQVAEAAVRAGACIINDISGFKLGLGTAQVAAATGAALVINHTYERPKVRPSSPPLYENLMDTVFSFLQERMAMAREAGVREEAIILDPGIAFGKSHDEDLAIIRGLRELESLRRPILVAPSRKHFIGSVAGAPVDERQAGTAAVVALAVAGGADIVRVHDVAQMAQAAAMADAIVHHEPGRYAPTPESWPAPAASANAG